MERLVPPAGAYEVGGPELVGIPERTAPVFLADAIDPETGEFRSILQGADPVEAWLLEQLRVRMGSGSAVTRAGNRFDSIRFLDDSFEHKFREELKFAWALALERRWIAIRRIDFNTEDVTANIRIVFDNLVSGVDGQSLTLPIGTLLPEAQ